LFNDPLDPINKGLAQQLITEAKRPRYKVLGIALLVLINALRKRPDLVGQIKQILQR